MVDAETGQRGFLLTGEDRYLQPYDDANRRIHGELDLLRERARMRTRRIARRIEVAPRHGDRKHRTARVAGAVRCLR